MALSTITATSAVIGERMTIYIHKASTGAKHTIEYAFGDTNGTIATKTAYPQISWTVPMDLMHQLPNNKTGYITLYCYTYEADKEIGYNYIQVPISIPEDSKATITLDCVEGDSKVAAVSSTFWKYTSDINYTINATAATGAEIVSYSITNGGETLTTKTGTFKNIADPYFYIVVTDSRGIATNERIYITLYDYVRLTCDLELKEVDPEDGIIYMNISGNFFYSTFNRPNTTANRNTLTLKVDCIDKDDNVVTKNVTATIDTANNSYTAEVSFEGIDYRKVYDITAYASDKLMDTQSKTVSVAGKPIFDWSNEDFRFHIPVTKVGDYDWADFVIETGTASMGSNGTWYWRKWKSGRAECYGSRNFGKVTISTNVVNNGSYYGYRSVTFNQELPADLFIDTPEVIDMRLKYTGADSPFGGIVWLVGEGVHRDNYKEETIIAPSKDNTGSFALFHTASSGSGYLLNASHIGFNVIGRWK